MLVGIISDTHGVLPSSVEAAFVGVDRIIHAGDVGAPWVVDHLERIAPVIAVRGNMDTGELGWRLQELAFFQCDTLRVLVVHQLSSVPNEKLSPGVDVIVSGHTHRASIAMLDDVLYINPGSVGGRSRDGRGPTAVLLDCAVHPPVARIVDL